MFFNLPSREKNDSLVCPLKQFQDDKKPLCIRGRGAKGECGQCVGAHSGFHDITINFLTQKLGVNLVPGESIQFKEVNVNTALIKIGLWDDGTFIPRQQVKLVRGVFSK